MSKINVVLADTNRDYCEALCEYILENAREKIQLTTFSKKEMLEDYLEKRADEVDILLAESEFIDEKYKEQVKSYAVLSEKAQNNSSDDRWINKFQKGEKIVEQLLNIHKNNNLIGRNDEITDTKIYAVYSPFSCASQREMTINIGKILSENKNKVLILPLNTLLKNKAFDSIDGKGLSNIIYYIKTKQDLNKIKRYFVSDNENNIEFIPPFQNFLEYYELQELEIATLIDYVCELREYDYIVADLTSDFGPVNRKILLSADKTFVPYAERLEEEVDKFKEDLKSDIDNKEIIEKMEFVHEKQQIKETIYKLEAANA